MGFFTTRRRGVLREAAEFFEGSEARHGAEFGSHVTSLLFKQPRHEDWGLPPAGLCSTRAAGTGELGFPEIEKACGGA